MSPLEIILQIVILLWLFIATKEKLEYEDFVELTEWEKVELVARAFGVYELGAPKKFTQEQTIKKEYQQRLQTNDIIKSDPSMATS